MILSYNIQILRKIYRNTPPKKYLILLLFTMITPIIGIACLTLITDPFALYHNYKNNLYEPKYEFISLNLRLIKPIQAFFKRPKTIFIGSSRIHHAFNPKSLANSKDIYNYGISALAINETYGFIKEAVLDSGVKNIYLGLDIFAFSKQQEKAGYDENIYKINNLISSIGETILSAKAIRYSISELIHNTIYLPQQWIHIKGKKPCFTKGGPPCQYKGKSIVATKGVWQNNGYMITPKLSVYSDTDPSDHFATVLRLRFSGLRFNDLDQRLNILNKIIAFTNDHNVKLVLFINPINSGFVNAYKKSGNYNKFVYIKRGIIDIAKKNNVLIWDFSTPNTVTNSKFTNRKEKLKNPYYIDLVHPTSIVGDYIMQRLGFKLKHNKSIPPDFGIKIN